MSNELIKITTNEEGIQLVSARELYLGLGYDISNGNFSRWIKQMLECVDAVESKDFTRFVFKDEGNNANVTDYIITTDIAKEICMIVGVTPRTNEETRKLSKEFRKYFIKCEEELKQLQTPSYMIDDKIARAEKWIIEEKQRQALCEKVEKLQPKADYYDNVLVGNDELLTISQIAKEFGMTGRKLNELLNKLGVQYKQGRIWVLYAKYDDEGYTKYVTHLVSGTGSVTYTKWTQKGRKFIYDILAENNIHPIC